METKITKTHFILPMSGRVREGQWGRGNALTHRNETTQSTERENRNETRFKALSQLVLKSKHTCF